MIPESEALERAASICLQHDFFWDAATAEAELTRSGEGDLRWRVMTGHQTKHWLEEEMDNSGRVLVMDANSGEFLGIETVRGLIDAKNVHLRNVKGGEE